MNKYIYAKIGAGNQLANQYLRGESEVNFPALPIYFDRTHSNEADFLKGGSAKGQGELFFECGRNIEGKFIVVINDGIVNIIRPTGNVLFEKITIQKGVYGYVKLLPIEIIKSLSVSHVPMVLASIGSNRYYSSGTFREISGLGNILAIRAVIGHSIDPPSSPSISHAIECLSSVEFETLVAKIFEESGCFVPAYRGGTMAGADLFAHNKSDSRISIGGLVIEPEASMSIQVKLKAHAKPLPSGIDLIVAGDAKETPNSLGSKWLQTALKNSPNTARWLKSSIDWLPEPYFEALRKIFYI